jgi:alkylation response protein AidB-like acyl-CoA dehydrogenase
VALSGSDEQKSQWLSGIASGEAILTPAWLEPENGFSPRGVELRATADGDGYRLNGCKRHVAFAAAADRVMVLARTGDEERSIDLFLVDPTAVGVTLRQQYTIASDTQYEVTLVDVAVSRDDRIGAAGSGWATWQEVLEGGLVLLAAQAVGGARYALEITTQYAKDRHQFDKPLGAFQALAHDLADAVTALDGAEQLVHEAAWAGANGRPLASLAPMAKLFACSTFRDITAMAQQIFGGIGFTIDFDIQLYFRRAKQLQVMWANDRVLEDAVAAELLD